MHDDMPRLIEQLHNSDHNARYVALLALAEIADVRAIDHPPALTTTQHMVNQGDIYWVQLEDTDTLEPRIRHPHVVIQDNVLNHSRLSTVVVCALTSNLTRASLPGNVLLEIGEAHLPRHSVVEVSKVSTIDKTQLGDFIGSLSEQRISQILAGMRFVQRSFFAG